MSREEYIKYLICKNGYNIKKFANIIDMPYSTLLSMLNGSIGGAAIDNVIKICKGLNITINDLQNCGQTEIDEINLSEKEKQMVIAYRQNENMQNAVDRLLKIDDDTIRLLKIARSNDSKVKYINDDDVSDLYNAEIIDVDL